ncbi:MAG: tetratricopeptide repeat protein, partial [Methanophagales archaeon]|nr:tetratricopeptide repeat protein [Methanophagales archaeon]
QVYHGCAAGLYDEVYWPIYVEKIGGQPCEYKIRQTLGALETNLSLVRTFFPEGDLSQMPLVSKKSDQSWLLNEAGLTLLNTGQPKEGEELFKRKLEMNVKERQYGPVSKGYQNLADLQFRTGELKLGLENAKKALDASEKAKSKSDNDIIYSKAYLAWILHLLGKSEEADKEFRQADELEEKIRGYRLYSHRGVNYANFFLSIKRTDEAFELTKQNLEICKRNNWQNNISRCHRCLGAIERIKGKPNEAEVHLQTALEIARKVCMPYLEIEALLESGRLYLDMGKHEDAIRDANEALKICTGTGFKLYEPEAEVVLGKAYLALNDIKQAKTFARSGYEKAVSMSYRWQEGDAAHLLGEIYLKMGDNVRAREWLDKAVECRKEILDPEVKELERMLEGL